MTTAVSVAMATWNGEPFLRRQLDSIASQTLRPVELVAVDDGSSDATLAILHEYAAEAPLTVHVHANPDRRGAVKTFERALSLCTGDVIALVDQDDMWHPDKLAVLVDHLRRPPAPLLVFSDARLVDDVGEPTGGTLWDAVGLDRARLGRLAGARALGVLLGNNLVTGATAAFGSELRDLAVPIPTHLPAHLHDGWLAALAAAAGRLRPVDDALMDYRVHDDQHVGVPNEAYRPDAGLVRRGRTAPDFTTHLALLAALEHRLGEPRHDDTVAAATARATVRDLSRHLAVRSSLPTNTLVRAGVVGRELARGGYRRWARGSVTALKDLAALATVPS